MTVCKAATDKNITLNIYIDLDKFKKEEAKKKQAQNHDRSFESPFR
jgi:hypothetical protein